MPNNKTQSGGSSYIADLAVPLGLVLAQRGLNYVFKKDSKSKQSGGGGAKHSCALCAQQSHSGGRTRRTTASAACNSQNTNCASYGGSSRERSAIASEMVRKEFAMLSEQLKNLLQTAQGG